MEAPLVATTATLSAVIKSGAAVGLARRPMGHFKTCALGLVGEPTSRAQVWARERDRSAGYGRG
jgi:hypothetical protein